MGKNPNFPADLDIRPLVNATTNDSSDADRNFNASAQEEAIREYGIAGRVWEAAYAMTAYLQPPKDLTYDPIFHSTSGPSWIIELGSGTGIVAAQIAEHLAGKDLVIATDLPEVCPLLERNLQQYIALQESSIPTVLVRPLSWGNHDDTLRIHEEILHNQQTSLYGAAFTHIICSDLVYFPELLAPLLRTLLHLTSPLFVPQHAPQPKVIISYKIRSLAKETPFWSAFGLWFTYEPVLEKCKVPSDQNYLGEWRRFGTSFGSDMFIFVARRRPESLEWSVPETDGELLEGVGAWGSNSRKGDGTFESLLLMSVDVED
ncbi:putative methyltransferase-domain-containing protein [Cristinia sonorae]|uniref:Methyltransferase-domain-containing protein n=1 Tax=Cristinia sonorae TaxID=1940300 RepID=A0A8K0XQE6_9AGAR|nr:putative methyltransferase-domain-containing protein [Cristinia sonorae]